MNKIIEITDLNYSYTSFKRSTEQFSLIKDIFSRHYIESHAINNVNLEIQQGEIIALLGPNGAGKTTLQKLLIGILTPKSGQILVSGMTPSKREKKLLSKIGVMFGQKGQLLQRLPFIDSLEFSRAIYKISKNDFTTRLHEISKLLEIEDILNKPIRNMSLGQRMRCELMNSLIHDPDIILLDEPTVGLDLVSQRIVREYIRYLNKVKGKTIILTSHQIADIEGLVNRFVIILDGKIFHDGDFDSLNNKVNQDHNEYQLNLLNSDGFHQRVMSESELRENILKEVNQGFQRIEITKNSLEDTLFKLFKAGSQ